jgi:hypothetical protein
MRSSASRAPLSSSQPAAGKVGHIEKCDVDRLALPTNVGIDLNQIVGVRLGGLRCGKIAGLRSDRVVDVLQGLLAGCRIAGLVGLTRTSEVIFDGLCFLFRYDAE